ncbi:unnamed protein product [Durusdinium trenchii]|uniref:Uncharacterized protein n=1 Tax=Durusdinium trenchii TaxID=1381693 RepID=A0ABP0HU74_9DINO
MERRIQELGQAFPYSYMPQMGAGLSVSQGQLDGLVQQMTDAFRHTQAPAPPPRMQDLWGGWSEPTTTTPEWQGQLKDLKEAPWLTVDAVLEREG